jgi:hypothetical protein
MVVAQVFKFFDKDDNGSIAATEIYTQARSLGLEVTMKQVRISGHLNLLRVRHSCSQVDRHS